MSHAGFLRQHWSTGDTAFLAYVRTVYDISVKTHDTRPSERVDLLCDGMNTLALAHETLALLRFVIRLTVWPSSMSKTEVERLESAGFDTLAIHDIVQVVACFSFMNRLADGTGVTLRADRTELAVELFGEEAWRRHESWSTGDAL